MTIDNLPIVGQTYRDRTDGTLWEVVGFEGRWQEGRELVRIKRPGTEAVTVETVREFVLDCESVEKAGNA